MSSSEPSSQEQENTSSGNIPAVDQEEQSSVTMSSNTQYTDTASSSSKRRKIGEQGSSNALTSSSSSSAGRKLLPRPQDSSTPHLRPILPAPNQGPQSAYYGQGDTFVHGPTSLPPVPYRGDSPYKLKNPTQNIHTTAASRLPAVEARINRLENAVERYIGQRGEEALARSTLPGMDKRSSGSDYDSNGSGNSSKGSK